MTYNSKLSDLDEIVHSAALISRETDLGNLIKLILKIVVEKFGATRAVFLKNKAGVLEIYGEMNSRTGIVEVLQEIPLDISSLSLPIAVIKSVLATKQKILLNLEQQYVFGFLMSEEKQKPMTVFCIPLVHQGNVLGILYLENDENPLAFNEKRQEGALILSSQIASSFQNALLCKKLNNAKVSLIESERKLEEYNRKLESIVAERTQEAKESKAQSHEALVSMRKIQDQLLKKEDVSLAKEELRVFFQDLLNSIDFINEISQKAIVMTEELSFQLKNSMPSEDHFSKLSQCLLKLHDHSRKVSLLIDSKP